MRTRTRTTKTKRRPKRTEIVPFKPSNKIAKPRQEDASSVAVYLASLGSDKSRASIYDSLKRVIRVLNFRDPPGTGDFVSVEHFPWERIRYRHMMVIRSKLASYAAPSTANHTLSAIRGVLEVAWKQRKITTDDYQRARSVKGVRGSRERPGRHIQSKEIAKLFAICGDGVSGVRDSAILAMLYGCGLRRAEVASALVQNLDLNKRSLKILGKGNKERLLFLPPGTARAVRDWIELRGTAPGPIFVALTRYGKLSQRGVSDEAIRKVVERIEASAKVKHVSPHDFRRTFVGDLLEAGVDVVTVQKLAGHASPMTTSRYDRRGDKTKKKAASMLDVPYKGETKR